MKNKSASNLGKLSHEKRLKTIASLGLTEAEYMSQVRRKTLGRNRGVDKKTKKVGKTGLISAHSTT